MFKCFLLKPLYASPFSPGKSQKYLQLSGRSRRNPARIIGAASDGEFDVCSDRIRGIIVNYGLRRVDESPVQGVSAPCDPESEERFRKCLCTFIYYDINTYSFCLRKLNT